MMNRVRDIEDEEIEFDAKLHDKELKKQGRINPNAERKIIGGMK